MDDVERRDGHRADDLNRTDARIAHDVAAVLLAHQCELDLESAEDAVAHERARRAHVALRPRRSQGVRHLDDVVDDAAFAERRIVRAQRFEGCLRRRRAGLTRPFAEVQLAGSRPEPALPPEARNRDEREDDPENQEDDDNPRARSGRSARAVAVRSVPVVVRVSAAVSAAGRGRPVVAAAAVSAAGRGRPVVAAPAAGAGEPHRSARSTRAGAGPRTPLASSVASLGRPAKCATARASKLGSTGLARCIWNPAAIARCESSTCA